jgi:pyridoxamine 5'-phosphate oxidase
MELESRRREYQYGELSRDNLHDSPFEQFDHWMLQALDAKIQDPTAMSIATVGPDGRPSQRIVLLKHFGTDGFEFYTNTESRKAREIAQNDNVCLLFPWLGMDRQVIVEGQARRLGITSTLKYFLSRPRESQLVAWSSAQSQRLDTRAMLDLEFQRMREKFARKQIPLPTFWGGYRVVPDRWEFWQGGEHRLHDRFQFTKGASAGWEISRLAP